MPICLIDTSIFVEIVKIPNMYNAYEETINDLENHIRQEVELLLPVATIIETGNHIAQNGNGDQRRICAERFVTHVCGAIDGTAPWRSTFFPDDQTLRTWIQAFPDSAMRGKSFGDMSIIKEWEKVCDQNQGHRVFIWSKDADLAGYDRIP